MTVMTQVDPFHLRPFFGLCPKEPGMLRKVTRLQRIAERATLLDYVHLAAIIGCSLWTANLIIEDRFGSIQTAAVQMKHSLHADHARPILTIRLDDVGRTAAR